MLDKIALIIPTRERVDRVALQAAELHRLTGDFADIHYVIDGDHERDHEYSRALHGYHHITHFQPWRGLSGTLNTMSSRLVQYYPYVGFMGDDHFPLTLGWDHVMINLMRDPGTLVAYGSDGQPDVDRWDHPPMTWWVMDSDLIHALGQMVPYVLQHVCVDDYAWQLGYQSDTLAYTPGVLMEHRHPLWGKASSDESYERSNAHHTRLSDHDRWAHYQRTQLPHDVVVAQRLRRSNG